MRPRTHIDALFTQVVDWDVIERHWHDMMQVVLSIQAGTVLPSMLLQKLGVYSRTARCIRRSVNWAVERTRFSSNICLMPRCGRSARRRPRRILPSVYRLDCVWGRCSAPGTRRARETDQVSGFSRECAIMLHNVVDMTNALVALQQEGVCVTPEASSRLSPYLNDISNGLGNTCWI